MTRRWITIGAIVVGSVGVATLAVSQTPTPALSAVAAADGYEQVTVTFATEVFAGQTTTTTGEVTGADGALTAADLTIAGTNQTVTAVAMGGDASAWTVSFDGAIAPHNTTITIGIDAVFTSDGTPVPPPSSPLPVPLTSTDLAGVLTAFAQVQVPLYESLPDVTITDANGATTTVANGGLPPFVGDFVSNGSAARPLTDLLGGLGALDTTGTLTEDLVATRFGALTGVAGVTFADGGAAVAFDETAAAATLADLTGAVVVPEIGLAAALTGTGDVLLSGGLEVRRVAANTYEVDAASTFDVALDATIDPTITDVPLGFVAVDLAGLSLEFTDVDLGLDLGCPSGAATCAPNAVTTDAADLSGSIAFALDSAAVRGGVAATGTDAPVLDATEPLATATWSLAGWDDTAGPIDVALLAPTTTTAAGTDVEDFARANFGNLVNGAQWLGDWLTGGVETQAALATPIPMLGDSLAELGQVGSSLTSTMGGVAAHFTPDDDAATVDPLAPATVQEAFGALCDLLDIAADETACDALLSSRVRVSTSGIEVDLAFAPAVAPTPYADGIPTLDLAHGSLADIAVTGQAGTWSGTSVATSYDMTLGLRTDDDAALQTSLSLPTNDWDGDGVLDDVDDDADGDGYPESTGLIVGDLCRGLATQLGLTPPEVLQANATAPGGVLTEADCDALVAPGTDVVGPGGTTTTLTAVDVCAALAAVGGLGADEFRTLNGFADDGTCATAKGSTTLNYDLEDMSTTSPVRQAHRTYVVPSGTTQSLVDLDVALNATGVTMSPRLGYLDGAITGTVAGTPTANVALREPVDARKVDGTLDLAEIASLTDAGDLGSLVAITTGGLVDADLTWTNTAVLPTGAALDVVITVATGAVAVDASALGDKLALADIDPDEAVAAVSGLAAQVRTITDSPLLAAELPMVGTSVTSMVGLVDTVEALTTELATALPPGVAALQSQLSDLTATAGLPPVTISVNADAMSIGLDLGREVTAAYPVDLDLADLLGIDALPISPADGGASVDATAAVTFTPTIALAFTGATLEDRISVAGLPSFEVGFVGEVYGGVHLGPLEANLTGTVALEGDAPGTRASVSVVLANGTPTVTWQGNARADLEITGPVGTGGTVSFDAPVATLLAGDITESQFDYSITAPSFSDINLGMLVDGITQTADLVGQAIEVGGGAAESLPVVGPELAAVGQAGVVIQDFATLVQTEFAAAAGDSAAFIDGLGATASAAVCPTVVEGCVTFAFVDGDEAVVSTMDLARGVVGTLSIDQLLASESFDLPSLDLGPDFSIDVNASPALEVGYTLDLGFGLTVDRGFYLEGGDLVTIYTKLDSGAITGSTTIGGAEIAQVVQTLDLGDGQTVNSRILVGAVAAGDGLGPDGDHGGFALAIPASGDDLSFADLVSGRIPVRELVDPRFELGVNADLGMEFGVNGATTLPIPTLEVPIHADWAIQGSLSEGISVGLPSMSLGEFDAGGEAVQYVQMDVSSLMEGVIAPLVTQVNEFNPFALPAVDTVMKANVPIIEDTVYNLADTFMANEPAWVLFTFLYKLDTVAASLSDPSVDRKVQVGAIAFGPGGVKCASGEPVWDQVPELKPVIDALEELAGSTGSRSSRTRTTTRPAGGSPFCSTAGATDANAPGSTTPTVNGGSATTSTTSTATGTTRSGNPRSLGQLLSFPILDDPMSAVGMVLGGDLAANVRFVEFNAPPVTIGPSISFSRNLASLDTGFLKGSLAVGLDGRLGLTARFGFGYDARGIQPGRSPLDGFYLVDAFGTDGRDVQEIALGGSVSAWVDGRFAIEVAGIDVAKATFRGAGGANLTGGIDLWDDSPALDEYDRNDGRLHLYEIERIMDSHTISGGTEGTVGSLANALCVFRPSVDFSAYLSFSGSASVIGIEVWDDSYSETFDIFSWQLYCPPKLVPAQLIDGFLVLNGGPDHAADRLVQTGETNESFGITHTSTTVTVAYGSSGSITFDRSEFPNGIRGDLGGGNDTVTVSTGLDVPLFLNGGAGNDSLQGGNADDVLDGGPGTDTIAGRDGADQINGGDGNDTLNGNVGADVVRGGGGNDTLNGDAGSDDLDGEAGDDTYRFDGTWGQDRVNDASGVDTLDLVTATALTASGSYGAGTVTDGTNTITYAERDIDVLLGGSGGDTIQVGAAAPNGFRVDGRVGADEVVVPTRGQTRAITVTDTDPADTSTADVVLGDAVDACTADRSTGDRLVVTGTLGDDTYLLRGETDLTGSAADAPSTPGFVAHLGPVTGTPTGETGPPRGVDRIGYDHSLELLCLQTGEGDDQVALDDNATVTGIDLGAGDDRVQVGQVYENLRDATALPAGELAFDTQDTLSGELSAGITHATVISGDLAVGATDAVSEGDDAFTIYSNKAPLSVNGNGGDDDFVARAFVMEASVTLNGEGGVDDFDYVINELLTIDGGTGDDLFIVVGTIMNDGFLLGEVTTDGTSSVKLRVCEQDSTGEALDLTTCAIDANVSNVEGYAVHGLGGDDLFVVEATAAGTVVYLYGSEHSDRFRVIGDVAAADPMAAIAGPVWIDGETGPFVAEIAEPVVLPGEDAAGSVDACTTLLEDVGAADCPGTDVGDEATVVAHGATGQGALTGELAAADVELAVEGGPDLRTVSRLTGLAMTTTAPVTFRGEPLAAGITADNLERHQIELGAGDDTFTVAGTDTATETTVLGWAGGDAIAVEAIDHLTTIHGDDGTDGTDGSAGADTITVGTPDMGTVRSVADIDAGLRVDGDGGADTLAVDDAADTNDDQVTITGTSVTGLDLHTDGITYAAIETLDVLTGSGADTVDVQATSAATTVTTGADDDGFYVSSLADGRTSDAMVLGGTLADVAGTLHLDAGAGEHELLISDRDASEAADATLAHASATGGRLSGLAPAAITWDADGTYARGTWLWTSDTADDVVAVTGSRADPSRRSVTTLITGGGADDVTVDLDAAQGPFVLEAGAGIDTVTAGDSARDLVAIGDDGSDTITTGSGDDLVLGPAADVTFADADGGVVTIHGDGQAHATDGATSTLGTVTPRSRGTDDVDTLTTGEGDDRVVGGAGGDIIRAGDDADTVFGDWAQFASGDWILDHAATAEVTGNDDLEGGEGPDELYGQQGNDTILGGAGDDVIEGNQGADTIEAGAGDDDVVGGSSASDGVLDTDRDLGGTTLDDGDVIDGGAGDDIVIGDNGRVTTPPLRTAAPSVAADAAASGTDQIRGGAGNDDLVGGHGDDAQTSVAVADCGDHASSSDAVIDVAGDLLCGGPGADAVIGDLGTATRPIRSDSQRIVTKAPFIDETYEVGELRIDVTLMESTAGDDDLLFGDAGDDAVHAGAGADLADGGADDDVVFGADGADALWGGLGDDHLYGGFGDDHLDVKPRSGDPEAWTVAAPDVDRDGTPGTPNGNDFTYGGDGRDAAQSDQGVAGPQPGDRMMDWYGPYNVYYVCDGAYGAGRVQNAPKPDSLDVLRALAQADGAVGDSGQVELALVTKDMRAANGPGKHPDWPGNNYDCQQ